MDSNAAKEIIHSCPITTYEAPINTRSPGLGGRPGELLLNMLCLGEVVVGGFYLLSDSVAPIHLIHI